MTQNIYNMIDCKMLHDAPREYLDPEKLTTVGEFLEARVRHGVIPGGQVLIEQADTIVGSWTAGYSSIEDAKPWSEDTLVRIYSMTKPVTSLAALILFERGQLRLDDHLEEFLPFFSDMMVLERGAVSINDTRPATQRITVRHLLTHTAGFTYPFNPGLLASSYLDHGVDLKRPADSMRDEAEKLAKLPLMFEPGTRWSYGFSTDILGLIVEEVSGMPLGAFFEQEIFSVLGMSETTFTVARKDISKLANVYGPRDDGLELLKTATQEGLQPIRQDCHSGGSGLISTARDYLKFARTLKGRSDAPDLVSRRTLELMRSNHLSGDLQACGEPLFAEVPFQGFGFGLGGWVLLDPVSAGVIGTKGEFGWGGRASTVFFVDPKVDLTVVFMTQLLPSNVHPLRGDLRTAIYQGLR